MAMLKSKVKSFVTRLQVRFDTFSCFSELSAVSVPVDMMFTVKPISPTLGNGAQLSCSI